MTEQVILDVRNGDGIQIWSLQFRPVNAIGPPLLTALHNQVSDTTGNEGVAAVILTSNLDVFSAGADARWMAEILESYGRDALTENFISAMDRFRELALRLRQSPFLVIAAIGGHALAGGLELAAACDLRFAVDDNNMKIGVPEMQLFGQMPSGAGGVQFLTRQMGASQAIRFILNAEPVSPRQAMDLGLVDCLYPRESLLHETENFAECVAKNAGRSGVSTLKQAVFLGYDLPLADAVDLDRRLHYESLHRSDFPATLETFVTRYAHKSNK